MGNFTPIDLNEDGTVGLMKYDGDVSEEFVAAEALDPELLIEAGERCQRMGWDAVDVNIMPGEEFPVLIHERRDDQGIYVAIAPLVEDD